MRLIDADKFLDALSVFQDKEHGNKHFMYGIETAMETLESQPTIEDVFSVVLCRECENFFNMSSSAFPCTGKCKLRGDYIFTNDYCSYGVRRKHETY